MFLINKSKRKSPQSSAPKAKQTKSQFAANGKAIMARAKKIRKPGEKWQNAVKRAAKELK